MELVRALTAAQPDVLDDAAKALQRAHLRHYEAAGAGEAVRRLNDLLALTIDCLTTRSLGPVCEYADQVARERFESGFEIGEVQTAFNVLEEAIWQDVIVALPAEDLAEASGLIGTVLGAGKDTLARTWVSLASRQHVPSLDLTALFRGTRN
jgi:hypothetical protein